MDCTAARAGKHCRERRGRDEEGREGGKEGGDRLPASGWEGCNGADEERGRGEWENEDGEGMAGRAFLQTARLPSG